MAAQKGKDLLVKIADGAGFTAVAGLRSRRLSFNAETIDITHAESANQWRELLDGAGIKRAAVAGRGLFKDAATDALMRQTFFDGAVENYQIVIPDFGTVQGAFDGLQSRTNSLALSTNGLARAMSQAFVGATSGGKQLDDVLKSLALRMSSLAVSAAFRPVASGISSGLSQLFSGLFSSGGSNSPATNVAAAMGAIKPFAAGGVIGTPTYFPMATGGLGLAGEAGPEAIVPLARGADGRLGVATSGGGAAASVTVNISTPDSDSFRRSEVYLTGQIARAVARGQRGL